MTYSNKMNTILGTNIPLRHSKVSYDNNAFKNPIIHKRIDGSVIVPLNKKLWEE